MEEKHQKNFLNTAEVADMLGISPATLRKWRAKILPSKVCAVIHHGL